MKNNLTLKVDIRVLTVESHLAGRIYSGTRAELINYMESVGYQHLPDAFKAIFQMGYLRL